ncbi:hypothetical protein ACFYL6_20695 [Micromonospora sp. NPDC007208]|uniref:hypothetical protein n=1 Tax=Micromonospora sp. NPDC007208 TaxID=3364236 RepID=UPI00368CCEDD
MTNHSSTPVDLSYAGVDRILAALAAAGIEVHYNETDGDTTIDVWLTDVEATTGPAVILSWRGTTGEGWTLREWADSDTTGQPARKWPIADGSLADVARDVAAILSNDESAKVITDPAFPGFAPGEHRGLLANVRTWARTNGWASHRDTGWQNPDRTIQVDWDEHGLSIGRRISADRMWPTPRLYPASSVRQAVDFLVALYILPMKFSSAYESGVKAGRLFADTDRIAGTR